MSKKPDDAAKIAGLASILKSSNRPKEAPPSPAPPVEAVAEVDILPARPSRKKPVGKYRDPNYHHYGVYLRMDSHKRANRRLEDTEPGKDFSTLMQELLDQWLASD